MKRRRYLALASGALAGVAGCTADVAPGSDGSDGDTPGGDGSDSPTGTPVEGTQTANGTIDIARLDASFAQRAVGQYYLAVATASSHGERLAAALDDPRDAGVDAFLQGTDYTRASVVCLQDAASSSHPDLEVTEAVVADSAATLAVQYPGNAFTADITTDLLLVRVADSTLEHATVELTPIGGETTRFSTVGRYGREQLDDPRPLVVRNRDCEPHHVEVSASVDGELVAQPTRTEEYPPSSIVRHGAFLTEAAPHAVRAWTAARETVVETTVSPTVAAATAVGVLVDVAGSGAVSVTSRPVSRLPDAASSGCEASSLPYESTDPSENVAEPVRLQWVNQSDADRTVRVRVRDGDRVVVDRAVSMTAGGKGRTEGLIAKRGVYDTSLRPGEGERRRVDWQVDEAGDDLQVVVETDGSLVVAGSSLAN